MKKLMMAALAAGLFCFTAQVSAQERVQTNVKVKASTAADKVVTDKSKTTTVAPARKEAPTPSTTPAASPATAPSSVKIHCGATMKKAPAVKAAPVKEKKEGTLR